MKVICTDVDGNGKTCQVRSCDDDYNFTSNYNLTQTFDVGLELTFLGIPTGKYLITVDDKYRFFKEITSIQNINSLEVELKQWLFKNGNECIHNTGGWMKCKISNDSLASYFNDGNKRALTSSPSVSQKIEFLSNSILFVHNSSASRGYYGPYGTNYYGIARINCKLYCGTQKHNPISLSKYSNLVVNGNKTITVSLRSGAVNSVDTATSTATVLVSGSGNNFKLNTVNTLASLVIGYSFYNAGYGVAPSGGYLDHVDSPNISVIPSSYSNKLENSINQIFLI